MTDFVFFYCLHLPFWYFLPCHTLNPYNIAHIRHVSKILIFTLIPSCRTFCFDNIPFNFLIILFAFLSVSFMCSFRSHSLFRVIPKYLNVYFNLSFLYLFIFLFLSSNYYCHVFFSFSVHYGIFFSASIFLHFLIPFLIVSTSLIAAMSSIKP